MSCITQTWRELFSEYHALHRGFFGKTSTGQGGPSSQLGQEGPNDQAAQRSAALPGGLQDQDESKHKHSKKRKKKHRDRPPEPPAPGEEQKVLCLSVTLGL